MGDSGVEQSRPGTGSGGFLRPLLAIVAVVVVLAALKAAAPLVVPIVVSVFVTVLVAPIERRLLQRGWRRLLAFAVVLAVAVLGLLVAVIAVELSLSAFIADLPAYEPGSQRILQDVLYAGKSLGLDLTHIVHTATTIQKAFSAADSLTRQLLHSLAGWTVVLVLTIFMLHEALDFPEKLRSAFGASAHLDRLAAFVDDLSGYARITTLGSALTAVGDLAVMAALGVPSAVLWAGLAFLFSYIPSVGYLMIVIPPTIATLVRYGFVRALAVLISLTVVDNAVGLIVVPRLIGKRLDVAPFWGMLSLIVWAWLLGPAGAVLAVPLTMLVKFLLDSSPATSPFGQLLAPAVPPATKRG